MGKALETEPMRVHWTNSLVVRVVALCVVLVLCLLGSVYVVTVHFLGQVIQEFEDEAVKMSNEARYSFEHHQEDADQIGSVRRDLQAKHPGVGIDVVPSEVTEQRMRTSSTITDKGIMITSHTVVAQQGRPSFEFTAEFTLNPREAVLRAFTNRYMLLLTAAFMIALGLIIYFIFKSLRPLRELSESCARISAGELVPVEVKKNYGEVLSLEHTFNKMVVALRDKEQIETNLRQAQRLSALGTLAAGIAHDVRNPLNAIKLLSSHALDTIEEQPGENGAAQQLRTIRKEVDRLEEIVSGFLALAKERELQSEPVKIDRMLEDCIRLVKAEAEAHDVRLTSELGAGDTQVEIDPKQVTRAVLNVIINAIEACTAGGRVRVFSRITENACQIEVRDDGPGLSKDVCERAFDPYFTTKQTGTGIGLSITRGIVEEHGGNISLSSIAGQGCQVLISLPLQRKVTK